MTEERLKLLIYKYLADNLTEGERQELNDCGAAQPEVWQLIARLQDEDQLTRDLRQLQRARDQAKRKKIPLLQNYSWKSVAATLVTTMVLIGGAVITLRHRAPAKNEAPPAMQARMPKTEMAPGSNKAFLTLGNGQQILLDSVHPGNLPYTDGSRALRTDNGLSYAFPPIQPFREMTYLQPRQETGHLLSDIPFHTLTTPGAGQFTVTLPDHSRVWLNNATSLQYPTAFTGMRREVRLWGEAYFEVATDPVRPFFVKAKGLQVQALGTSFNVMAYPDEKIMRTTLLTGSVKLFNDTRQQLLKPDEQLIIEDNKAWSKPEKADPEDISAWKAGYFRFDHTPVPLAMQRLSRWYNKEIEIRGPVKQRFCTAMLKRNLELSEILKTLNLVYREEGNRLIIIK